MFPEIKRNLLLFKIFKDRNIHSDISRQVHAFLYKNYKTIQERRQKTICFYINAATSRKNGFGNQEVNDTDDPHWIFNIPRFDQVVISYNSSDYAEVQLQAINCEHCGNYVATQMNGLPENILCEGC